MRQISIKTFLIVCLLIYSFGSRTAFGKDHVISSNKPVLVKAVMCESIEKLVPINESVAFSVDTGQVFCFTDFDPVPEKRTIYHRWYRKGVLISVKPLTLKPTRWSSFSSMQLRATDKGPWQIDITDEEGSIYKTLRFSITD